jgi:hypothetical protein
VLQLRKLAAAGEEDDTSAFPVEHEHEQMLSSLPRLVESKLAFPFAWVRDAHLLLMDRHTRVRGHAVFRHDHDLRRVDSDHVGNYHALQRPNSEGSVSFFRIAVIAFIL